ncbi:FecR family protein [Siphonobacter aquaeclarae]|uniref:FecR family protein n=1 Tax=Siphonobacter aquaeclarae TaxID=563176 RepID=A0A1G9K1V1_9BACT|nr:FecR domain-containing protein [Siphonobacter aquaeclarae]SDL43662.1 FecR family protein [Siphonobacter aquaeclarae]
MSPELLEKYHQGTCSEAEKRVVEQWLSSDGLPDDLPVCPEEEDVVSAVWSAIEPPARPRFRRWMIGLAAAIAVAVGLYVFQTKSPEQVRETTVAAAPSQTLAFVTRPGERRQLTLPDSSVVTLNAGSRLTYTGADTLRSLTLEGEAFFEVYRDTLRPFEIAAAQTHIRVLGTAFNVRAYPGDRETSLVVAHGKVHFSAIGKHPSEVVLTAQQKGISRPGKAIERRRVWGDAAWSWKEHTLVFDNQPLREIAVTMERWYGIRVVIASDDLGERRCSGTFANPSVDELMQGLSYALNLHYRKQGNTITIY